VLLLRVVVLLLLRFFTLCSKTCRYCYP